MLKASELRDALNSDTPAARLTELSKHPNKDVRIRVARNPSTPTSVLNRLALDLHDGVRIEVTRNPAIQPSLLEKLAADNSAQIRHAVVRNPSTSINLLEKLAKDPDDEVRREVAERDDLTEELYMLLAADTYEGVLVSLCYNRKVTRKVLATIAVYPQTHELKGALLYASRSPLNLLARLAFDEDILIRSRAMEKIENLSNPRFKRYVKELGFAELMQVELPRQWVLRIIAGVA